MLRTCTYLFCICNTFPLHRAHSILLCLLSLFIYTCPPCLYILTLHLYNSIIFAISHFPIPLFPPCGFSFTIYNRSSLHINRRPCFHYLSQIETCCVVSFFIIGHTLLSLSTNFFSNFPFHPLFSPLPPSLSFFCRVLHYNLPPAT